MATTIGILLGLISVALGGWSVKLGRVALAASSRSDDTLHKVATMVFVSELRAIAEARDRMDACTRLNDDNGTFAAMVAIRRSLDVIVDYADETDKDLRSDLGAAVLGALQAFSRTPAAGATKAMTTLIPGVVNVASQIDPDRADSFGRFDTLRPSSPASSR